MLIVPHLSLSVLGTRPVPNYVSKHAGFSGSFHTDHLPHRTSPRLYDALDDDMQLGGLRNLSMTRTSPWKDHSRLEPWDEHEREKLTSPRWKGTEDLANNKLPMSQHTVETIKDVSIDFSCVGGTVMF